MFPLKLRKNDKEYVQSAIPNSIEDLKEFLLINPNEIYVIADEKSDEDVEPLFTEFLVIYIKEFKESVTLYDISREIHSHITIDLGFLVRGYIEHIEVGRVDRFPLAIYIPKEAN